MEALTEIQVSQENGVPTRVSNPSHSAGSYILFYILNVVKWLQKGKLSDFFTGYLLSEKGKYGSSFSPMSVIALLIAEELG